MQRRATLDVSTSQSLLKTYQYWRKRKAILLITRITEQCLLTGGNSSWHLTLSIFGFLKLQYLLASVVSFPPTLAWWCLFNLCHRLFLPFPSLQYATPQSSVFCLLLSVSWRSPHTQHHRLLKCWFLTSTDPQTLSPTLGACPVFSTASGDCLGISDTGISNQYVPNQTHYLCHPNSFFFSSRLSANYIIFYYVLG